MCSLININVITVVVSPHSNVSQSVNTHCDPRDFLRVGSAACVVRLRARIAGGRVAAV